MPQRKPHTKAQYDERTRTADAAVQKHIRSTVCAMGQPNIHGAIHDPHASWHKSDHTQLGLRAVTAADTTCFAIRKLTRLRLARMVCPSACAVAQGYLAAGQPNPHTCARLVRRLSRHDVDIVFTTERGRHNTRARPPPPRHGAMAMAQQARHCFRDRTRPPQHRGAVTAPTTWCDGYGTTSPSLLPRQNAAAVTREHSRRLTDMAR